MNTQSRGRRLLAVASATVVTVVLAIAAGSAPAGAAAVQGYLSIESVTDRNSGLPAPVQDRAFDVAVRVLDDADQPITVSRATTVRLEASGPGTLSGTTSATIRRGQSGVTIFGAIYSTYANGVELRVSVDSGVDLDPHEATNPKTVDVALTAVGKVATAQDALTLRDSNCSAPTANVPTCGSELLLPHGAVGRVTMSVNSCEGIVPGGCLDASGTEALVVSASGAIDGLYPKNEPATLVLACDKVLCGQSAAGLTQLPVVYLLNNEDTTWDTAPACPAKGVLGDDQEVCVDYVQSSRSRGDLYTYILFDRDPRFSHP
jgi:hypothetical protein